MRFLLAILLVLPLSVSAKPNIDIHSSVECLLDPVTQLAANPVIIKRVTDYNIHPADVETLEQEWPSLTSDSPVIRKLVSNPAAKKLQKFIKNISVQGEGFAIGLNGGLAAATNKTSDFWQGDEAQFTKTIKLPPGKTKIFEAKIDQSAETVVLKIAAPIYSTDKKKNIGVLVIGFDAIVLDFLQLCKN